MFFLSSILTWKILNFTSYEDKWKEMIELKCPRFIQLSSIRFLPNFGGFIFPPCTTNSKQLFGNSVCCVAQWSACEHVTLTIIATQPWLKYAGVSLYQMWCSTSSISTSGSLSEMLSGPSPGLFNQNLHFTDIAGQLVDTLNWKALY